MLGAHLLDIIIQFVKTVLLWLEHLTYLYLLTQLFYFLVFVLHLFLVVLYFLPTFFLYLLYFAVCLRILYL